MLIIQPSNSFIFSSSACILQVIRPFILRRRKDEVEKYLPSKTQVILKCDLSAWQKVYYQQVTEMGRVGLAHGEYFLILVSLPSLLAYLKMWLLSSITALLHCFM